MAELMPGEVEVRLAGSLADFSPHGPRLRVPAGWSVAQAAAQAGLPPHQRYIAVVNGQTRDGDYVLRAGDAVSLLPPISGGR
jgi:sulfur carrier protein ThiS